MRCAFTILAILLCRSLVAQYTFQAYTPANGLVDARVHTIFQDRKGILYFLTRDGFSSFDGQRFTNFTQTHDMPVSVTNNMVQLQDGSLLISAVSGIFCLEGGLLYRDTTLFKPVIEPGDFIPLQNGRWLLPAYSGLYLYDGKSLQKLNSQSLNATGAPLNIDRATGAGSFMAAITGGKLVLYNWQTQELSHTLTGTTVLDLVQYQSRHFINTERGWLQLNAAAWNQGKLVTEPLYFQQYIPKGFSFNRFYIDARQNIWLISPGRGLCCIRVGTNSPVFYTPATGLPQGVNNIYSDMEGNTWMIVPGKAVYKMVQSRVTIFTPGQALSLCGSQEGMVLGKKDTLLRFTEQGQQLMRIQTPPGSIRAFYWNGDWWHLLANAVLMSAGGRRIALQRTMEGTASLSAKLSFDRENRLLVAGNYLNVIDRNYRQWSLKLPYFTDRIVADEQNNYWCFSRRGDIVQYHLQHDSLQQLLTLPTLRYSTREVMHWNSDTFCIGTRTAGLVILKADQAGYRYLSVLDRARGLSNNFITELHKTGAHSLLAATVTGLDMLYFNGTDTTVEQLYARIKVFDGVQQMARLDDSTVLALNEDRRVYQVNIKAQDKTGYMPGLFFNQVKVNGKTVDTSGDIFFAYNENNLRVAVSAPSFIDEKNIRFSFSLRGKTLESHQEGLLADFEIANLPPGQYELRVTAYFPGYQYAAQSMRYAFVIRKPFWKTTGFTGAVMLVLLLTIYVLFRSILRRRLLQQRIQLEKEKAVAGERTRIATDMHDELGAGISTIKYLSQSAPFIAPEVQKDNNLKIAAQADELVDKMNDIIWAMNESNDTLDNLLYYCKAWVVEYCDAHHLSATVLLPGTIQQQTVRGDVRQHIFLCIKEAVHNIVKHAGATAVQLQFTFTSDKLDIVISDNGKGFDQQKIKRGNGLYNIEKRVKAVKGTLELTGTNGTCLHFSVPF